MIIQTLSTVRVRFILLIIVMIAFVAITILYFSCSKSPSIGFIQTKELVYKYTGMKDAQSAFKEKEHQWQESIDTLRRAYQIALGEYNAQAGKISSDEMQKRELYVRKQEQNLQQYVQAIREKSKEEEARMTQDVLNRINSVVTDYAKKHGYVYILGTTDNGSLLYGESKFDLTNEILEELNRSYKRTDGVSGKKSTE